MADNQFSIICPTDCSGTTPSMATVNPDCPGKFSRSEIYSILFMSPTLGVGPADWSSLTDWQAVIDNTDTTGVSVKQLFGIGSLADEEPTEIPYSNGVVGYGSRTFTVTFNLKITDDSQYELLRTLQCSGFPLQKVWFVTRDNNYLYGKDVVGIQTKSFQVSLPLEEGDDSYIGGVITFTFEAETSADRIASPF